MKREAGANAMYTTCMGIEDRLIAGIDRKKQEGRKAHAQELWSGVEVPPDIAKAHERMKAEIFSNRAYAVQAPEFIDVYGEEKVKQDMRKVLELKKKFEARETPETRRAKILSEVFEGLVLIGAREGKWFGEANFLKTSSYDD